VKSRNLLFGFLAIAISLSLVVAIAELGVRIAFHESKEFTLEMWKYARTMKRVASDPRVGHEHVPNTSARLMGVDVSINSHKLRDREIPFEKPTGVKRIVMLGDSLVFGWGVDFESTSSKVLERELNAGRPQPNVEVINTGVGNYNTSMEVQYFLNEGHRYSPDIVVLNYFINDAEETPRYTGNFLNEHLLSWVYVAGRADIVRRMAGSAKDWNRYYSDLYRDQAPGWLQTQAAVRKLGRWCQDNGVLCIFANQPELHDLANYPFSSINERLARLAEEAGFEYVDLLSSVRDEPEESLWVTVPDPHPNNKACTLFGRALAARLSGRI
jgi:hypothetical protein